MDYTQLTAQARQATEELLEAAHLETGDIFVVGCSSSEIMGGHIGHDSSMEAAAAVLAGGGAPARGAGGCAPAIAGAGCLSGRSML